ncbi:flagellar biosynthesis protein FlhB [Desulfurobacterium atlanticum]|uniref:Flagellar biosynthetic protein FlhB n=1 Tax=Desulfurobacterium atlanticum TaxID=240169 RepID=A0A238YZU9_9BACT|nr:flagellar biosynthesis protein FlhB [Desulfurobacterium atlanticum]SNR76620.1 flagellar biosynthetic protein FlhB [Desulfurobacterium atlanticum]
MAKDPSKTEKATPRRRQKAREEGQVLKSQDVPIAATLIAMFGILVFYIPFASNKLIGYFYYTFSQADNLLYPNFLFFTGKIFLLLSLSVMLPLLVVGIASNVAQFGFLFSTKALQPKLDMINPVKGLGRLFSLKTLFETFKNVLKLTVAIIVAYYTVKPIFPSIFSMFTFSINQQIYFMMKYMLILILAFGIFSIPIAGIDFFYRRYEYEENLKMSKEEVKEEHKQQEGHPVIKSEIRKRQREVAMRRMMAEVPKADVVITNPEHYAVALKYERGKMEAPKVVAKGVDDIALKIKEIAREHDVPIVEDPPLARTLYESCDIGDFIPEELYVAVARILAKIYRKKGKL